MFEADLGDGVEVGEAVFEQVASLSLSLSVSLSLSPSLSLSLCVCECHSICLHDSFCQST